MHRFDALVASFLAHFWHTHPVDASFAGAPGYDHVFPPAERDAPARERAELAEFGRRLSEIEVPDDAAARLDACLMRGYIASTLAQSDRRSRFVNPTWYTGEIAFGIIALLLPGSVEREPAALGARVGAIPDQLGAARAHLDAQPVPADWVRRARLEIAALVRLLQRGLPQHPLGMHVTPEAVSAAVDALARFDRAIADVPDADPAAGADLLALLMRDVHGLAETPAALERTAAAEFERLLDELQAAAAGLHSGLSWRACVDELTAPDLRSEDVVASLRTWNDRALTDAAELLTPATEYGLDFAPLPDWAADIYADLYFLFYRAPAAFAPGSGSLYWATGPQSTAMVKLVHAVHHGSIGHHTQNARARSAHSQLARIAGGDGASGIALLGGGTLGEGWACYAEDLLAEVPGFYSQREALLLTAFELRNVATALGDIRLHSGVWTLEEMRRFYRDEAAFAPARVWSETTRNSIFPASRLMYWTGTRQIRALRAQSPLTAKAFHDRLLSFGSAPVAAIAPELADSGTRR